MKKYKKFLLILLLVPCLFILNACSFFKDSEAYVTSIEKTEIVGNSSTYTVHFSDGTHSTLTIKDGDDGENGNALTIESIKSYCSSNNINFESFLKEYLTVVQVVEKAPTIQDATNIALQSTVSVWCEFPTSDHLGSNKNIKIGCGAGIIYKMDETYSYIITNYHVVFYKGCDTADDIAREIHIFQYGGDENAYQLTQKNSYGREVPVYDAQGYPEVVYGNGAINATYVGGELKYDICVIKVKTEDLLSFNPYAKPVEIANTYAIGETVMAIGNPETCGTSVTSGIISVVSEELEMTGADDETECVFRVMRIDAAINGGNSGGGLFNVYGQWLGIVNAKRVSTNIDNIAFALPYDDVVAVVDNILYYYNGVTPSRIKMLNLNVTVSSENKHPVYNPTTNRTTVVEDVKVSSVDENSVGKLMQFKVGDIVRSITINETKYEIQRTYEFLNLILTIRAGDKILVEVERDNNPVLQTLSLANENGVLETYLTTIS